jgi:hypothetical protein
MKAVAYLIKKQWSMGNGQCPECQGMQPGGWYRPPESLRPCSPFAPTPEHEGHERGCELAEAIESADWPVKYRSAE